jgi:hypothetical protein
VPSALEPQPPQCRPRPHENVAAARSGRVRLLLHHASVNDRLWSVWEMGFEYRLPSACTRARPGRASPCAEPTRSPNSPGFSGPWHGGSSAPRVHTACCAAHVCVAPPLPSMRCSRRSCARRASSGLGCSSAARGSTFSRSARPNNKPRNSEVLALSHVSKVRCEVSQEISSFASSMPSHRTVRPIQIFSAVVLRASLSEFLLQVSL